MQSFRVRTLFVRRERRKTNFCFLLMSVTWAPNAKKQSTAVAVLCFLCSLCVRMQLGVAGPAQSAATVSTGCGAPG
jgi:hypothetical protein